MTNDTAANILNAPAPADLLKTWGIAVLRDAGSPSPLLDTQILLSACCKKDRSYFALHPDCIIPSELVAQFHTYVKRRATGEPIAYMLGTKDFWKHSFFVSPDVLIPKPDTEVLVEQAILHLEQVIKNKQRGAVVRIADICTGSGCVVVSVVSDILEQCRAHGVHLIVHAVDISDRALAVAHKNSQDILGENAPVTFFCGDLTAPLRTQDSDKQSDTVIDGTYDLIMSNPPYVPSDVTTELLKDGRNEPRLALDGGKDGMALITRLICESYPLLTKGGTLMMETGEYETEATAQYLVTHGFNNIVTYKDLEGQNRVIGAVKI